MTKTKNTTSKTSKTRAKPKSKAKKLASKPCIRRRLLKIWSEQCRSTVNYTCIVCGARQIRDGEIPDGEKLVKKVDAHHIVGKEIHNSFFKFNLTNGACLCPKCHKFGNNSAHRNAVFFINFIQTKYPDTFKYLITNNEVRIDLENRDVLSEIEEKLKQGLPLDLDKIRIIENSKKNPINKDISTQKESNNNPLFDENFNIN